jgi:hypothetical protein
MPYGLSSKTTPTPTNTELVGSIMTKLSMIAITPVQQIFQNLRILLSINGKCFARMDSIPDIETNKIGVNLYWDSGP